MQVSTSTSSEVDVEAIETLKENYNIDYVTYNLLVNETKVENSDLELIIQVLNQIKQQEKINVSLEDRVDGGQSINVYLKDGSIETYVFTGKYFACNGTFYKYSDELMETFLSWLSEQRK